MGARSAQPQDERLRVPLDRADREKVRQQARENGRSVGREAAMLIKAGIREREKRNATPSDG